MTVSRKQVESGKSVVCRRVAGEAEEILDLIEFGQEGQLGDDFPRRLDALRMLVISVA